MIFELRWFITGFKYSPSFICQELWKENRALCAFNMILLFISRQQYLILKVPFLKRVSHCSVPQPRFLLALCVAHGTMCQIWLRRSHTRPQFFLLWCRYLMHSLRKLWWELKSSKSFSFYELKICAFYHLLHFQMTHLSEYEIHYLAK